MTTPPSSGLAVQPDPALPFPPELEAEYDRSRLLNARTLIRMTSLLALMTTMFRIGEIAATGPRQYFSFGGFPLPFAGIVLSASVALVWLAWSRSFLRRYLPAARLLVPARNLVGSFALAGMVAHGQTELLMMAPIMVLGPFFFLGLRFRTAAVCVALTLASFGAAALAFALPVGVLLRSCGFMAVVAATSAVAAWQIERQSRRSFVASRLIAQLAEHDALTGAKNRRVFDARLAQLWQQALDERHTLAIVLLDVDHFKAYNDRYGHQAGDVALRRVAEVVQSFVCRSPDVLARYGGEEFAAIFYGIDGRRACEIAEGMRRAVSALGIEHRGSRAGNVVTISIGVAAIEPSAQREPRGALQLADEALYAAKVRGRNNVQLAGEPEYRDLQTGVFLRQMPGAKAAGG